MKLLCEGPGCIFHGNNFRIVYGAKVTLPSCLFRGGYLLVWGALYHTQIKIWNNILLSVGLGGGVCNSLKLFTGLLTLLTGFMCLGGNELRLAS
jgi:hypothetical protein